jgi:hypothetical protein
MILHQRTHPRLDVDGCFGCKAAGIRIAAAATPTRRADTYERDVAWERQMRDDAAYKSLVADGLQPARTKGCHELAQTDDKRFIEGMPALWEDRGEYLMDTSDTPQVNVAEVMG